jgi:hypothetical protein
MTDQTWLIIITGCGLLVNLVGAIVGGTWILSKNSEKLLNKINERITLERKEIDFRLTQIEAEAENGLDETRKWFGENMAAIREKITQTELWNRDNFVNKNTFQVVMKDFKDFFTRFEDKLDLRFNRLESKLDKSKQ